MTSTAGAGRELKHPDRQPLRLEVGSVLPGTLKVYMEGVSRFLRYCGVVRPGQSLVLPREEVDGLMVGFIQHLYDTDGYYSHAQMAVSGLKYIRQSLADYLPRSERALKSWKLQEPPMQHAPLPQPMVYVLALHWARMGCLDYSLAVLLAFDCYLRVGELVGLKIGQITLGGPDSHLPANLPGGIDLPHSKTGDNQSVLPRCPVVLGLLKLLTAGRRKEDRLFSFSAAVFRKALTAACGELGVDFHYTPHCIRDGGASLDYMLAVPMADIQIRGRWRSLQSCAHYIQAGRALFLMQDLPAALCRLGHRLIESGSRFLSTLLSAAQLARASSSSTSSVSTFSTSSTASSATSSFPSFPRSATGLPPRHHATSSSFGASSTSLSLISSTSSTASSSFSSSPSLSRSATGLPLRHRGTMPPGSY